MVPDVQNRRDRRQIPINRVGVKNIRYPIIVLDRVNKEQHTVAWINMFVNLPHRFKGTHMSRFIEVLNKHHGRISINNFLDILEELKVKLKAQAAHVEMEFPYFIEKRAPVSGEKSLMEYRCRYLGESEGPGGTERGRKKFLVGISVPVTTLCPCSKEMSTRGAHNQRGEVTVTLAFRKFFWIEDVIEIIEQSASAPVYALLKREDEKVLTERAYDHPRFVEDVVREVSKRLKKNGNFPWFTVEAENFESIHNHSAYASVEYKA
jgi:GTP cyclohydrolase I